MSLDHFEQAINEISDKDWSWWPFRSFRPQKHEPMSLGRLVAMALVYGLPCAGLLCLSTAVLQPQLQRDAALVAAGAQLFFLFLTSIVIGPMWNRRAERLRIKSAGVWGKSSPTTD